MSESKLESADTVVDTAADKLQDTAESLAAQGGVKAKVAEPLADDAEFLRKLKPSKMVERAKGEAPTDEPPVTVAERSSPKGKGPSPWVVVGIALAVGILVARIIDWRGHAHPR
jgi:hypothetical protein